MMFEAGRALPDYPKSAAFAAMVAAGVAAATEAGTRGIHPVLVVLAAVALIGAAFFAEVKHNRDTLCAALIGAGIGVGVAGVAVPLDRPDVSWSLAAVTGAFAVVVTGYWVATKVMLPGTSKALIERRQKRAERNRGMAGRLEVMEFASAAAMRTRVGTIRPSLRSLSWWRRRMLPMRQVAVQLAHLGVGILPWHRIYAAFEDFVIMFGGPRIGKTVALALIALRAPGALITTSTRTDLAEWVHAVRSVEDWVRTSWVTRAWLRVRAFVTRTPYVRPMPKPRRVHVWNPSTAYLKVPSTAMWSVLTGCEDYETASRRANDMIPDSGDQSEMARWDGYARPLLAIMMHAAKLDGRTMLDVQRWLADDPGEGKSNCEARKEIEVAIERYSDNARILLMELAQHYAKAHRTRASVTHTVQQATRWLSYDHALILGDSPPVVDPDQEDGGLMPLDIPQLLRNWETLHILGHEDQPDLAPLNRCLLGEVKHQERVLSGESLDERIDPPVTEALDEAGLVARAPLDRWSADMGGRGVFTIASFQSLAQMRAKMGRDAAGTALGNATLMQFGGGNNAEDLKELAELSGTTRFRNLGEQLEAADSHTVKNVLDVAALRSLPKGYVAVFRTEMLPVLGKAPAIWRLRGAVRTRLNTLTGAKQAKAAAAAIVLPEQKSEEVSS